MKCLFAVVVIWIPLAILLTACYPLETAVRCDPNTWAHNGCRDDQDRMTQGKGTSKPEPAREKPTKPEKPDKPDC